MNQTNEHLDTLKEIRSIMERSQRFISLSGLSGISAGVCGLIASLIAYFYMENRFSLLEEVHKDGIYNYENWGIGVFAFFFGLSIVTLIAALGSAFLFTQIKARKIGKNAWDAQSKRLFFNAAVPLVTGGLLVLIFLKRGYLGIIAPLTLIFYGLACVSASRYTFEDIRNLGYCEIVLGLLSMYFIGYGLLFWALGFGVLHIIYGIILYKKYD